LTVDVIPPAYRPPEIFFSSKRYSETVDIWSVGCIFYELLMGKRPFDALQPNQAIFQMMNIVGLS
jgi:serine/threonine protein kinase